MTPVNTITITLILGLELFAIGINEDSNWKKITGMIIMMVGWILNMIAILT
jgi:hypothetical protein